MLDGADTIEKLPYFLEKPRLFKISAERIGGYGRRAVNRGGRLLISPVGNQAYLSSIIQFTHRVINKEAIETGFPCFPTIKK